MRLPRAYRSLSRPSSHIEPSYPSNGVGLPFGVVKRRFL